MAERLQRSYDLHCSEDALLAALAQPDVVRRRSEGDGLGTRVLKHEVSDDAVRIVVSTDIPLDWLPSAITSQLGGSPTVERMEEWRRYDTGLRSPLVFEFAAVRAWGHCLRRMTAHQAQALQAYEQHMRAVGKGTGRYASLAMRVRGAAGTIFVGWQALVEQGGIL